eukprot:UN00646
MFLRRRYIHNDKMPYLVMFLEPSLRYDSIYLVFSTFISVIIRQNSSFVASIFTSIIAFAQKIILRILNTGLTPR